FLLSALAAIYGGTYLLAYREEKSLGAPWFFFTLLVASMVLVVIARNGVLFLVAWEVMALTSFFLVTFADEEHTVREAGWIYLVATHLSTACVLTLFVLLGQGRGSLDFDHFSSISSLTNVVFLLAVIGFGTKAGVMPFHVWLPDAHPAAPSHVSALMSGVMIKTGIYGLLRTLTFLGAPPAWWGWVLCGIGVTSGVFGVLFALAQHDLKRLLAYHSVENIGIIALGLGVGVIGLSSGSPTLAVLGFAGGLLHVLNHALFKGLLFLGAGAVLHATGTREIDHLGGLLKRMPWTGAAFLTGAVAICGLPPLNGFISEFLIYLGAFHSVTSVEGTSAVVALGVIAGLALIGGLAAACFTKAFGVVFLGEPRSEHAAHAHEVGLAMRLPMLLLAGSCVFVGLCAPAVVAALASPLSSITGLPEDQVQTHLRSATGPLWFVVLATFGLICLTLVLGGLRRWLLADRSVAEHGTWDCGYAQPTPRMQYTASSFAQPLTEIFRLFLRTRSRVLSVQGLFPHTASLATETDDVCSTSLYRPVFTGIQWLLSWLRWLQHGQVHLYILYIAVTLLVLLVWKLG
ncbi:MAG: hydrogenase, partial [Deltaproteobacteria bacterium]|nr:hydrogenase [Deltaproteobacteria bacterium]